MGLLPTQKLDMPQLVDGCGGGGGRGGGSWGRGEVGEGGGG